MQMVAHDYQRALDAACREYESLAKQRADIDGRLAELHETIVALTRLCGHTPIVPLGLTDACRLVLKQAGRPMSPLELRERLRAIGLDLSRYSNDLATLHTVLKRLHESGEVRRLARAPGKHSYEWTPGRTLVIGLPAALAPAALAQAALGAIGPKRKRSES